MQAMSAMLSPTRVMTKERMQQDFEYEMAQKICNELFQNGLLNENELRRVTMLNIAAFKPFFLELV